MGMLEDLIGDPTFLEDIPEHKRVKIARVNLSYLIMVLLTKQYKKQVIYLDEFSKFG